MSQELLVEIGTEEIPAGYIEPALRHLHKTVVAKLGELNLSHGTIKTTATPRRLCLVVEDLDTCQQDQRLEVMGPPKKAGFDKDNNPTKAALGFAASRGASADDIQLVETPKGEYLMVVQEIKGKQSSELLQKLLPEAILSIPFPKSMRWAAHQTLFARPIQWLLAIYDSKVVPFSITGIESSNRTKGHRFNAPQEAEVANFAQYKSTLAELEVQIDIETRQELIRQQVGKAAASTGGEAIIDNQLLATVTNLVESPHAVCGSFDEKFLSLPDEVLTTSMAVNQKYFTVADKKGTLLPYFVAVNNTKVTDLAKSKEGHERVLRARLEDGLFFFQQDLKRSLSETIPALQGVVFQAGLGTMAEKSTRITALAGHLASLIDPELQHDVERASQLCKVDLVSDMVGEFASLQGVIGKYYALHGGESAQVAEAISDHYLPLRSGSALPTSDAGAFISIADRLDTICGCFAKGKRPTGATDPYGLRRHALAIIHIIADKGWQISLHGTVERALQQYGDKIDSDPKTAGAIIDFIKGRYSNDKIAAGSNQETVEAATSVHFDDMNDCSSRINALSEIANDETFTLLAGSFKRVTNIIKGHTDTTINEALLTQPAEQALSTQFSSVAKQCAPLLQQKEYGQALQTILTLKDPIDTFFDDVMVMDKDEAVKANRLALLTTIAHLFRHIGDFSKMYTLAK